MAFPFEPSHLRVQQRTHSLALANDHLDSTTRIIRPVPAATFDKSKPFSWRDFQPESPPIPYDTQDPPRHKATHSYSHHKRLSTSSVHKHSRKKSRHSVASKKKLKPAEMLGTAEMLETADMLEKASDLDVSTTGEPSIETSDSREKKHKDKKNPLAKLFFKTSRSSASELDTASLSPASGSLGSVESLPAESIEEESEESISDSNSTSKSNFGSSNDTLDHGDVSGEDTDDVSSKSTFTDIEGESMIDVSPEMLYTYEADIKSKKQKNIPGDSMLDPSTLKSSLAPKTESSVKQTSPTKLERHGTLRKRSSFIFSKVYDPAPQSSEVRSNLSMMIQSRHKSSNVNPLTFFSFVETERAEKVQMAQFDLFVPPEVKPALTALSVASNITVFDCIGVCLKRLSEISGYMPQDDQTQWMNPNHWRMELTDEDGELYDSTFGVLDRTRLLGSYNCPRHLALCRVKTPAEISRNEKHSPLPLEFRQNLEEYAKRLDTPVIVQDKNFTTQNFGFSSNNNVEVKVANIPNMSMKFISFFVGSSMRVGELFDLICRQYQVDPAVYKLCGCKAEKIESQGLLLKSNASDSSRQKLIPLEVSKFLSDVDCNEFKVVPIKQPIRSMLELKTKQDSVIETGITPNSSTFQSSITPPIAQLEQKLQGMALESETTGSKHSQTKSADVKKYEIKSNNVPKQGGMNDFMGRTINHFPTSLNTIYFKWGVFRKKPPLLTRIEKSLILDGDYVHLAPTDDTSWRNSIHNSFAGPSQSGNHHHHYLHHYNYSKYYNESMLKTSSFHISQIIKIKQYKESKNPTHFKIVIHKEGSHGGKDTVVKKKYDLEAETVAQCEDIIEKIKWALNAYNTSNAA